MTFFRPEQLRQLRADMRAQDEDRDPFREHIWLLQQATQNPPGSRAPWVTSFSDWIFDLCVPSRPTSALAVGKRGEREIRAAFRQRRRGLERPRSLLNGEWKLIFEDPLQDAPSPEGRGAKKISSLKVGESPFWGIPDLVYRNINTGEILIIDRKISRANVPDYGWPNLKVQLWCYSWIDDWIDANEVHLAGEIWIEKGFEFVQSPTRPPQWRRGNMKFQRECLELFEAYGGTFKKMRPSRRDPR
ncbi:MAG: hypothetical protein HY261_11450 [Chloroflexi bacterium]|nr:hypothetical protein [Chloroflexota bacterium]